MTPNRLRANVQLEFDPREQTVPEYYSSVDRYQSLLLNLEDKGLTDSEYQHLRMKANIRYDKDIDELNNSVNIFKGLWDEVKMQLRSMGLRSAEELKKLEEQCAAIAFLNAANERYRMGHPTALHEHGLHGPRCGCRVCDPPP